MLEIVSLSFIRLRAPLDFIVRHPGAQHRAFGEFVTNDDYPDRTIGLRQIITRDDHTDNIGIASFSGQK